MKLNIFETIMHALSVGNWLQNILFYFLLLAMTHVVVFQSKLLSSGLRTDMTDGDI
ncbi:MAG: hypothetical protein JSU01_06635 [Bacteroidetes bacterium]|nr:hypothetical protein [Bacteroidota bacterium]